MTTLKRQVSQKNKSLFPKKRTEFNGYTKASIEQTSEIISDKLIKIIKKNVC